MMKFGVIYKLPKINIIKSVITNESKPPGFLLIYELIKFLLLNAVISLTVNIQNYTSTLNKYQHNFMRGIARLLHYF